MSSEKMLKRVDLQRVIQTFIGRVFKHAKTSEEVMLKEERQRAVSCLFVCFFLSKAKRLSARC